MWVFPKYVTRLIARGIIAFLMAVVFFACAGESEAKQEQHAEIAASGVDVQGAAINDDTVIGAYLLLKDALVKSDAEESKRRATTLAERLAAAENAAASELQASVQAFVASKNLKEQRQHFFTLSNAMIAFVEAGGKAPGALYVQHCPMAFDFTGADWISNTREIRNPYFGDEMLTCGFVKSELAMAKSTDSLSQ